MFTKTFFRLGLACLVLAQMVVPTFGMPAPVRNIAQETPTTLQTGFSRPSLPGLDCSDPGTGGSGSGCGGG
ncbi:MAG: hypothetical protein H6636_04585 [Anaerolineales bacterium]|nr:hypothetical protein [Anaerolineales bacterium]